MPADRSMSCQPPIRSFDNDFHEVWWNSVAGGDAPKGKLKTPLHEVWQWMGDAPDPAWRRPGEGQDTSADNAYAEGWRYVRKIELLNYRRKDGEPPIIPNLRLEQFMTGRGDIDLPALRRDQFALLCGQRSRIAAIACPSCPYKYRDNLLNLRYVCSCGDKAWRYNCGQRSVRPNSRKCMMVTDGPSLST